MDAKTSRQLIEAYVERFNAADWSGLVGFLDDDVVHDPNESERQIGAERFHAFLGEMRRHYEETIADAVVMVSEDGTRGALEATARGRYVATAEGLPEADGQSYSIPFGMFFAFENDRIRRVTTYYNRAAWAADVSRG